MKKPGFGKHLMINYLSAIMAFLGAGSLLPALSEDTAPPEIDPMEHVTCYDTAMPVLPKEVELDSLKQSLELLETEYKEHKISEDTYNVRKADIEKQIKLIEESPY